MLTLKDPQVDRLARDLAALTGEPIEEAVARAIDERLAHERQRRDRQALLDRARRIVRDSGAVVPTPVGDPSAFLYDERGLPD
jgi:antitoxin VapB